MRVIGYVRVSTNDQATEGVSLDAQKARIGGWCTARGLTLDEGDVHVDAGISGKRADNRPGLQAALDAVCRERGVLVVYSLSRLARSTKDAISIAERLKKAGAELVSLTENLDTTTATGKLLYRMLAILAEFERDIIAERTRTALGHKRSKSERLGQVPYGVRLADDGRTLVPDEAEQEALAAVHRWRSEGLSLRGIAAELTRQGVPTKNGGATWTHTSVAEILKREPYHEPKDGAAAASGCSEQAHAQLSVA
jgi:DNA invertase Pin-like site-specific DNA recombinase